MIKNLVQKRCIHNPCKSRDKAPRPSVFMSKPSGQLTCSTPELRAQLNLTNDHKKKEPPYLQECPDASTWSHVMLKIVELRTLLGKVGRDCCRSFRLCSGILVKVVSPKYSGQLFNTHSTDV